MSTTSASVASKNTQSTETNEEITSTTATVPNEIVSIIEQMAMDENSDEYETSVEDQNQEEYVPFGHSKSVRWYSRGELNDLVRNLGSSKETAERLASDFEKRGMVKKQPKLAFIKQEINTFGNFSDQKKT